ncbi:putative exonuclease [Erwinia phage pEp_SNUABM_08]|uniref:Putative exonuclease n=1 Tax=Erwinia phage pEp_SNUABM_08 TaxID=2593268 RepID=A0A5J6DAA0_9CAUD|nr:exonuclease recombination-associated [Erwinia phage pEp_SNUABM_08]QEQ94799.1 putative exonuclease [Erwinia phage pEp_SNUABM_08]
MATYANKLKGFNVMRLEKSMVGDAYPLKHLWSGHSAEEVARAMNLQVKEASEAGGTLYAEDPASSAWLKYGFARIMDALPFIEIEWEDDSDFDPADTIFHALDNGQIFAVLERRERILPGDTLRAEVQKEGDKLAKRQGEPLNRKQWAEIKDAVAARMLAKALVRTRQIPVLFQRSANDPAIYDVFYFTSSHKVVEDLNAALFRRAFGSFPVYPFENDLTLPVKWLLTRILKSDDSDKPWTTFVPYTSAKLVDKMSGGSAYSFKDQILRDSDGDFDPLVKEALDQDYEVDNMSMRFWQKSPIDMPLGYTSFKLNAKGVFSGVKISDVLVAERGSVEDDSAALDFHAYMYLLTDVLRDMVGHLEDLSCHYSPDRQRDDEDGTGKIGEEEVVGEEDINEDDQL